MAGYTGVSSGEWRDPPDDDTTGPEVYLIYEEVRLFRGIGPAPGSIEEVTGAGAELTYGANFGWSFGDATAIKITGGNVGEDDPFTIHRSPSAGDTWTIPIQTTLLARLARAGDDMYAPSEGGGISRTVDSGTTWNEIVPAPGDGLQWGACCVSTNYMYLEQEVTE